MLFAFLHSNFVLAQHPDDEWWIINTRSITSEVCCADLSSPSLRVTKVNQSRAFDAQSTEQLIATLKTDPSKQTVIYVHGNRFTHQDALERACFVQRQLARCRQTDQPIRFILWSWPSEQTGVLLTDVRTKAQRTDTQGLYLAWFLREMQVDANQPAAPLTLIGYSFGGRVVTGALHALAGGNLGGRTLSDGTLVGLSAKVGLLAAAIDESWLCPGEYHGLATKNIDRLTLMFNPNDIVLKRYWLLEKGNFARALGVVSSVRLGCRIDGTQVPVKSYNCAQSVGTHHDELDYYSRRCNAGGILSGLIAQPPTQ